MYFSFKKFIAFIVIIFSLFSFLGCKWFDEKPVQPLNVKIQNKTKNCFSNLEVVLESYLKSEIQDKEINDFFDCTEKSIDDFMQKTEERDSKKGYSTKEIESLFKTFLLSPGQETVNSQRYSKMFLVIKRAILGGDSDYFTRQEWQRIKSFMPLLKKIFIDTKPYTQYYYFYNKEYYRNRRHDFKRLASSHMEFETRLLKFFSDLKSFGSLLNKNEIQYIKDEILSHGDLKDIEPLLNEVIYIFYSFPESQHQQNWSELFKIAERGLRVMTYVKRSQLQSLSFFQPQGGVALGALTKSIIDAFETAYKVNSSLRLEQELVERFVLSLNQSKLFLVNTKNESDVLDFIAKIGRSLFTYVNEDQKWYISGFKINHFKFLHNRWMLSLIKSIEKTNFIDLKEQYSNLLFSDVDFDLDSEQQALDIYNSIVLDSNVNLVFPGKEYKINFQPPMRQNENDLSQSQFYKTMMANIALLIFDTYGKQATASENSKKNVTEQTAARFYNDIRKIALSEGIGSPLTCDAGSRTFLEANLFAYSANGNDSIEIEEGVEWLSLGVSSSSVANKLYSDILATPDCDLPKESLFQNRPFVKQECVRKHIVSNYKTIFNHLPNLIYFIESQNKVDDFYTNMFEVTRSCDSAELPISYDEIIYSVTLLGYIEALFERYDVQKTNYYFFTRERNEVLEADELELAFQDRFKNVLQRMAKIRSGVELSESNTEHLFKKLMIYKRLPDVPSGTWESLVWWSSDRGVSVRPVNRIDVYKVFNSILTSGETNDFQKQYCRSLKLAWEEYQHQQIFNIVVPERVCSESQVNF